MLYVVWLESIAYSLVAVSILDVIAKAIDWVVYNVRQEWLLRRVRRNNPNAQRIPYEWPK